MREAAITDATCFILPAMPLIIWTFPMKYVHPKFVVQNMAGCCYLNKLTTAGFNLHVSNPLTKQRISLPSCGS
ncbi:hypothetical protein GOBAR_AA33439 [Gossypium barbadense]|uniref:Uncharacterized protein n=1 Tax=Gossypium barbadense TaxID=3634 RepID=A0A2P5W855_GOSBA|nr:hypothetical protein GOBAR_AA33439 [Gossypium barbadense]